MTGQQQQQLGRSNSVRFGGIKVNELSPRQAQAYIYDLRKHISATTLDLDDSAVDLQQLKLESLGVVRVLQL
jgi:hypothetical protein